MFGALSGRTKYYSNQVADWRKKIKYLPKAVRDDIAKRNKKAIDNKKKPQYTPNEKFEMWCDLVKKLGTLLPYSYITEDGIKLGNFQDTVLGALSGRDKRYSKHVADWREKINDLPKAVRDDIAERIKNIIDSRTL